MSEKVLLKEGENLLSFETDKLTDEYTLKIPEITKKKIRTLSPSYRKILNQKIMEAMASVLHQASFKAEKYLKSSDGEE